MKIGNKNISPDFSPFIIAEMSGNHNRSLERALEIVESCICYRCPCFKVRHIQLIPSHWMSSKTNFLFKMTAVCGKEIAL